MMTVTPSVFVGFDLLVCAGCRQPLRLILKKGPRPAGQKPLTRRDHNRVMRSARRMNQRKKLNELQ